MAEAPLTVSDLLGALWRRKLRVLADVVCVRPSPTLQEKPVSPHVPIMLLLGLIAATSAGLGSALLGGIRPPVANPALSRRPTVPRGNGKGTPTPVSVSSA